MKLKPKNMTRCLLVCSTFLLTVNSCRKDAEPIDDPRLKYIGEWNFKGNSYSFSGYYVYTPDPVWTYSETSSTNYNDSTGSIQLGQSPNELILKYCGSCDPVIYDLNENSLGSWTLSETDFFNEIAPAPPGYSPSYSTYNIEGWKL